MEQVISRLQGGHYRQNSLYWQPLYQGFTIFFNCASTSGKIKPFLTTLQGRWVSWAAVHVINYSRYISILAMVHLGALQTEATQLPIHSGRSGREGWVLSYWKSAPPLWQALPNISLVICWSLYIFYLCISFSFFSHFKNLMFLFLLLIAMFVLSCFVRSWEVLSLPWQQCKELMRKTYWLVNVQMHQTQNSNINNIT